MCGAVQVVCLLVEEGTPRRGLPRAFPKEVLTSSPLHLPALHLSCPASHRIASHVTAAAGSNVFSHLTEKVDSRPAAGPPLGRDGAFLASRFPPLSRDLGSPLTRSSPCWLQSGKPHQRRPHAFYNRAPVFEAHFHPRETQSDRRDGCDITYTHSRSRWRSRLWCGVRADIARSSPSTTPPRPSTPTTDRIRGTHGAAALRAFFQ